MILRVGRFHVAEIWNFNKMFAAFQLLQSLEMIKSKKWNCLFCIFFYYISLLQQCTKTIPYTTLFFSDNKSVTHVSTKHVFCYELACFLNVVKVWLMINPLNETANKKVKKNVST